jgi:hypothetical protein
MRMEADAVVSFPRSLVWRTYRDELLALVKYMPNISAVEVKEREDGYGGDSKQTRMLNVWRARSSIPVVAQPWLKPDMLSWDDYAVWNEGTWSCRWETKTHFFRDRTRSSGVTRFVEEGARTRIVLEGDFTLDLSGMPGVPRILASKIERGVESFIVSLLAPNVKTVAKSLDEHLRATQASATL